MTIKKKQIEILKNENQPFQSSSTLRVEKNVVNDHRQIQAVSSSNSGENAMANRSVSVFQSFANNIDPKDLAKLRSIGSSKKEDSTFVLNAVQFLYKNDTKKISSLSLTGRSREVEPKNRMTPEKRKMIENLFAERLHSFDLDSTEVSTRNSKISSHMKNAFNTVKRSTKEMAKETTNQTDNTQTHTNTNNEAD